MIIVYFKRDEAPFTALDAVRVIYHDEWLELFDAEGSLVAGFRQSQLQGYYLAREEKKDK